MLDNKKIIVYGTGKISKAFIMSKSYTIVGILDMFRIGGDYLGYPIFDWKEINKDICDCIVIAAPRKYIKEIYFRIIGKCLGLAIPIYDHYGNELNIRFGMEMLWKEQNEVCMKSKEELKRLIDEHDAISFDIFDTLIMRTTLDSLDVLDHVERNLRDKYDICIENFRIKHRMADYESKGGSLDEILEIIREDNKISKADVDIIKRVEIECEKDHLIKRNDIVDLLEYAVKCGKSVNLISDMYLTSNILTEILDKLDINGYEKIYVSCEYGVSKNSGLFEVYKKEVNADSYLHIGDNIKADYESAIETGIDAYRIYSSYEMLSISSMRSVLQYVRTEDEKAYIAQYISKKFNSPFVFSGTNTTIRVDSIDELVESFILPILISYIKRMIANVKSNDYDVVVLGARDCYLIKRLLDEKLIDLGCNYIYLYCSRRLAWRASLVNEKMLNEFIDYYISEHVNPVPSFKNVFSDFIDIDWEAHSIDEIVDIIKCNKSIIFSKSNGVRAVYKNYIRNCGVTGEILFCDLNSQGTVQNALNCILGKNIHGFYLQWIDGCLKRNLLQESVYNEENYVGDYNELLESIFTSLEPSVWDIDVNGQIVFKNDSRTAMDLEFVEVIQNKIIKCFRESDFLDYDFSDEFSEKMLSMVSNVIFEGEAVIINKVNLRNDLGNEVYKIN